MNAQTHAKQSNEAGQVVMSVTLAEAVYGLVTSERAWGAEAERPRPRQARAARPFIRTC